MTDIQTKMAEVHRQIVSEDYYTSRYANVMQRLGMDPEKVQKGEYPDKKMVELAHYFWESLPDSQAIRTGPFFKLCDIAENIFDDEL